LTFFIQFSDGINSALSTGDLILHVMQLPPQSGRVAVLFISPLCDSSRLQYVI